MRINTFFAENESLENDIILSIKEKPVINEKNISIFFKYIVERHNIYKKRFIQMKTAPWTDDPILNKYKFTNVFRDLDPGTLYVIRNILHACDTPQEKIFNTIIYRLYNKIETFNHIGIQKIENFSKNSLESKLRELKKRGIPVFTNAFTVSGYSFVNPEADKIANTCTLISWVHDDIEEITSKILKNRDSKNTYKVLLEIRGVGIFLAYQIAVDLGYWDTSVFNESQFTVAGPGCRRGINRIYTSRGDLSYEECISYTCQIQDEWFERVGFNTIELFDDREEKKLNVMAMENCFCEISKYLKAYYEEGRPRNRYDPLKSRSIFEYF